LILWSKNHQDYVKINPNQPHVRGESQYQDITKFKATLQREIKTKQLKSWKDHQFIATILISFSFIACLQASKGKKEIAKTGKRN
jgi:hypothetical protein